MPQTFETFIEQERERLSKAKEDALAKKQEAEDELAAIEVDLAAVAAYEAAKKGKRPAASKAEGDKKLRAPRQTGKRLEVLKLVEQHPDGVTRGELIDKLSIKGDKTGEQSLSNALAALKKQGQVTQEGGKYKAA